MSSKKREEIESEVRSYVVHFLPCGAFCISLGYSRVMSKDRMGRCVRGQLIHFRLFFFCRILKAGEKRATDLLKEKEVELHRVRNISPLLSG